MVQRVYEDKIKDTNNNTTKLQVSVNDTLARELLQNQSVEFVIFSVWTLSSHDFSLTENNIKKEVGKTPRISWKRCYLHRLVSNITLNRIPFLAINFHINQLTSNQFPIVQIDSTRVACILNLLTGFTRVEHCPHPAITCAKLTIKTYVKYIQS